MPSPKPTRNGTSPKVSERSMSFTGKPAVYPGNGENLRRPKTVPDLKSAMRNGAVSPPLKEENQVKMKLTKVLLNVSIQGSVGAVQVIISPDLKVRDLITATVKQYVKEGRRPIISFSNVDDFDLHYSQFSLESLDKDEKVAELGSRNFFLCKRSKEVSETMLSSSSCSKEAEMTTQLASPCPPWLKFMSFLF